MRHRVLIIEDNVQNRYLMRFLLESAGFTVIEAGSGPEGITQAHRHRPEAILLDIQLPEMDGYAVARELKADPDMGSIPIIAVTSYALAGDRERILASGADGYLEKPIDPERFVELVSGFLPPVDPA